MAIDPDEEHDRVEALRLAAEIAPVVGSVQAEGMIKDPDLTVPLFLGEEDEFRPRKIVVIAEAFRQRARTATWEQKLAVISGIAASVVMIVQARRRLRKKRQDPLDGE